LGVGDEGVAISYPGGAGSLVEDRDDDRVVVRDGVDGVDAVIRDLVHVDIVLVACEESPARILWAEAIRVALGKLDWGAVDHDPVRRETGGMGDAQLDDVGAIEAGALSQHLWRRGGRGRLRHGRLLAGEWVLHVASHTTVRELTGGRFAALSGYELYGEQDDVDARVAELLLRSTDLIRDAEHIDARLREL
jgi:hypothetical protein